MFTDTVSPETKRLLATLAQEQFVHKYYLAGGTVLALHYGHRVSYDLDFFSQTPEEKALATRQRYQQAKPPRYRLVEGVPAKTAFGRRCFGSSIQPQIQNRRFQKEILWSCYVHDLFGCLSCIFSSRVNSQLNFVSGQFRLCQSLLTDFKVD